MEPSGRIVGVTQSFLRLRERVGGLLRLLADPSSLHGAGYFCVPVHKQGDLSLAASSSCLILCGLTGKLLEGQGAPQS